MVSELFLSRSLNIEGSDSKNKRAACIQSVGVGIMQKMLFLLFWIDWFPAGFRVSYEVLQQQSLKCPH